MKTVENLKPGETLLRSVRVYTDGSYGIELCEMRKDQPINVAALWSCSAPATISLAEAEPSLTSTTTGTVLISAGTAASTSLPSRE